MQNIDVSASLERVIAARHRPEQYRDHLEVALGYRPALTPFRSYEIEGAVQLVASAVTEAIQRARGKDPAVVEAARARIDELSIVLEELCRELAFTEASA